MKTPVTVIPDIPPQPEIHQNPRQEFNSCDQRAGSQTFLPAPPRAPAGQGIQNLCAESPGQQHCPVRASAPHKLQKAVSHAAHSKNTAVFRRFFHRYPSRSIFPAGDSLYFGAAPPLFSMRAAPCRTGSARRSGRVLKQKNSRPASGQDLCTGTGRFS